MPSRPLDDMMPSMTYSGSLLLFMEVVPRTRTFAPAPGIPLDAVTSTPAVRPCKISGMFFTGWSLKLRAPMVDTEPVRSLFFTVP